MLAWIVSNLNAPTPQRLNAPTPQVLLWPDTFTNYFQPQIAQAAVEVLEAAGYRVLVPEAPLCCGRPLYDYGMLDRAERLLRQALEALRPALAAGIPVVGLEPSCIAVFRDELTNLLADDEDAQRLRRQSFLLGEFLASAEGCHPPRPGALSARKALVHGHCHQKALMGMGADEKLLSQMGLEFEVLDSGCCGLAGGFGYEKEHYDVSMKVGEHVLLPRVRSADPDTLIIADGFSCREQIAQSTNRRALHLAQVLQMALREGARGPGGPYPENGYVPETKALVPPALVGGAAGLLLAGAAAFYARKWLAKR